MSRQDEKKPEVSVIIPVYNAQKYIRQTMDYLLHQTLESIELIFVDDQSTDQSREIIMEYKKQYPQKIFLYDSQHGGPGEARNIGIKHARADYIGFADADDYMEYDMYEKMFEETKKQSCDLVYTPYYLIRDCKKKVMGQLSIPLDISQLIFQGEVSFWTKLIHKDLLKKVGEIPAIWFEDTAYMPVLFSYAQNIVYLDEPLYYYMKREGSITNRMEDRKTLDTIRAENYALEHCNPKYLSAVAARVADRILFNIRTRWYYSGEFMKHLKEHKDLFLENPILKQYPMRYQKILHYIEYPGEKIPEILYVTAFGKEKEQHKRQALQYAKEVFEIEAKLVILDEETCDVFETDQVRKAYEDGNYEYVGHYFAIKHLFENGGIYLGEGIELHQSFEYLRSFSSFFGFLDENTFTDRVIGCCKGDKVIKELWKTYKYPPFYKDPMEPLKNRIRNILVAFAGVRLDNQTHFYDYPCAVFDSSVFVIQGNHAMHVCSHNFEKYYKDHAYTVLPTSTVVSLAGKSSEDAKDLRQELNRVTALKNKLLGQRKELRRENRKLKRKVEAYENSTSWRWTAVFRKGGRLLRKL